MHIQDNDTQRNLSTVSEPSEMKKDGRMAAVMWWCDGLCTSYAAFHAVVDDLCSLQGSG